MVLALSEAGQRAAEFGLAAAAALAVWFVLLAVLAMWSRPRLPEPAPAGMDIPGSESPAVVGFLTNRWEVGRETVPATLLDLAARGAVSIDQVSPERFVCRLKRNVAADLTHYERQVLDHIRGLASDGVVPCEALTTGPEDQSKGWWERFQKAVVADARAKGLSRGRWGKPALMALGIVAVVPALLASAAFVLAPKEDSSSSSSEDEDPVMTFLASGFFGWGLLMSIPFTLRAERDTPLGREEAARWLGLREYLDEDESFDRAPPAAVAIWDRYLAYGAAMGVAAGAVRALPLGAESDREAWSAYGGHWHVVRVRYPERFPPAWGRHPLAAVAQGLATLAAAAIVVKTIGPAVAEAVPDLLDAGRDGGWETWAYVGLAVAGAIVAVAAWFVVRAAYLLLAGVSDLVTTAQVEGLVIRLRGGYMAVDDGTQSRVRAWRVQPAKLGAIGRGDVVRVAVSPRLGHVYEVEPVDQRPHQAGLEGAAVDAAPMAAAAADPGIDLARVEARTGVRLRFPTGASVPAFPGADRSFLLSDGESGTVFVVVSTEHGAEATPAVASRLLGWAARRDSAPIEGLGDEASWGARRNLLTARRGDKRVTVMVGLEDLAPDRRLEVARALADALL